MKTRLLLAAASMALAAASAPAMAHTLIIGEPADPGPGDCFPVGCGQHWMPQYQQVYASTDFSGPITITALIFYDHNFPTSHPPAGGTFTFDLSETSAAVDGLDLTDLANNIGSNDTVVFSGLLPPKTGQRLVIPLSTPYTYDPSQGNLLMNVVAPGAFGCCIFFDDRFHTAAGLFSRAASGGTDFLDTGLVTGFRDNAPVPEPATWATMLIGVGLIGAGARARRRLGQAA